MGGNVRYDTIHDVGYIYREKIVRADIYVCKVSVSVGRLSLTTVAFMELFKIMKGGKTDDCAFFSFGCVFSLGVQRIVLFYFRSRHAPRIGSNGAKEMDRRCQKVLGIERDLTCFG